MEKSADAFRTISEVAEDLVLPQHVLRFWETRFAQIKPLKRGGGRRYYRPDDVALVRAIKHFLYGEGYTIKGVQRILREQGLQAVIAMARQAAAASAQPRNPAVALDEELLSSDMPPDEADDGSSAWVTPEDAASPAVAAIGNGLSQADIGCLQAVLAELDECSRLLSAALA